MCSTYKGKSFSYKLIEKEPVFLYNEIYKILTEKLGILSVNEHNQKRLLFEEIETGMRETSEEWSKIRRKNIKDIIIEIYVVTMKRTYNLSIIQARKLKSAIHLALQFKTITPADVEYVDGEIISIDGISFRQGKIVLNKTVTNFS